MTNSPEIGLVRCSRLLNAWAFLVLTSLALAGPADALLKLTPPDAAATLVVEDLANQIDLIKASPILAKLRTLPTVAKWLTSDEFKELGRSKAELQSALNIGDIGNLLETVFGDAVVLSLEIPPRKKLEDARGLLLVKARDPKRLRELVDAINQHQLREDPQLVIRPLVHGGVAYFGRDFKAQPKSDYYVIFEDGRYACSDSEPAIQAVIERSLDQQPGLSSKPRFGAVRGRLPEKMLAALYVDPTALTPFLGGLQSPKDPQAERFVVVLARYLSAMVYAGLGVEWREGVHVHLHEAHDPDKVDPLIKRWAAKKGNFQGLLDKVPASSIALATGSVDFESARELLFHLVGEKDRIKLENMALAIKGIMLGLDLPKEVLPNLGPAVLAYLDEPGEVSKTNWRWSSVGVIGLGNESVPRLTVALTNGLTTLMAARAMDANGQGKSVRVEAVPVGDATLIRFAGLADAGIAFAVGNNYVAAGNSSDVLASFLKGGTAGPSNLQRIKARYFADARNFISLDTKGLCRAARNQRTHWGDAASDIEKALSLLDAFTGAYATVSVAEDGSWAHRTIGFVAEPK